MKEFERLSAFFNANLTLFTAVPLLLGGMHQFVSLASISFGYVKFYSFTQQLSDGLVLAVILIFIWIFYEFLNYKELINRLKDLRSESKQNTITRLIRDSILSILGSLLYLAVYLKYFKFFDISSTTIFDFVFYVLFFAKVLLTIENMLSVIVVLSFRFAKFKVIEEKQSMKSASRILSTIKSAIPTILLCLVLFLLRDFNMLPTELANMETLTSRIKQDNKTLNVDVKYFNDKYIFVEVDDEIHIMKLESLFEIKPISE